MTESTTAKIGNAYIIGPAKWELTSGVDPYVGEFDVITEDADKLLQGGLQPKKLEVTTPGHPKFEVEALYVLQKKASPNPNHSRIVVVDRRWFWRHALVFGRFNIRRRIGTRRVGEPDIAELQPVVPDFAYAPWSTRTGTGNYNDRWLAQQLLRHVLDQAVAAETDAGGETPNIVIRGSLGTDISVENLELDGAASDMLRRLLAYLPAADVTVRANGEVVVYNTTEGTEGGPAVLLREIQGAGHLEKIDLSRVRPSRINVYFDREMEVRFDTLADGETTTQDARFMDNVLPIPDYSLSVGGETLTQGTWITFRQAFQAWGTLPRLDVPLSDEICRQAFIPGMSLMAAIGEVGKRAPDADWVSRIAAVSQHWRQTYRINRRWMDRISGLRANRVALLDPTTGQRAEAQAYTNYCVISSVRSLYLSQAGGADGGHMPYATNVVGYPSAAITSDINASPFRVTVVDEEQGIIRFDHIMDPLRLREMVLPSMMELFGEGASNVLPASAGPTADIRDQDIFPITFDALTSSMQPPALTATHKIATILTARPGSPNGKTQLHKITMYPDYVKDLVPQSVRTSLDNCNGPPLDVRIGASIETARVAWVHGLRELIERAFGIGVSEEDANDPVDLGSLTVNQNDESRGASLWEIAAAQAASVWAALVDRYQGQASGEVHADIRVTGFLDSIRYNIDKDGIPTMMLDYPDRVEPLDLAAFMDANTYRIVKRLLGPAGRQT